MKITIENGKETVINLSGQLDTLTSVDLEKEIAPILQGEAQTVVLDGAELTYISSAGLRLLLTLQKGMKNKASSDERSSILHPFDSLSIRVYQLQSRCQQK
jgi:anti-sigma B factor antagonist